MPLTASIIGGGALLGGGVLSFLGGQSQASAQERAAMAQAEALKRQSELAFEAQRQAIEQRTKERDLALGFAAPGADELSARSNYLDLQEQVLGRTRRELDFLQRGLDITSPGAAQAGQGLFSSLIARQRSAQRAKLESELRQRLGAGYATTSAGQSALQQFDQGTVDVAAQAIPAFLQQAYQSIGAPVSLEQSIKNRQISAAQGTPLSPLFGEMAGLRAQFAGPLAQSAQAPFVGQAARGQAMAGLGSNISQIGGMFLGKGLGGMFNVTGGGQGNVFLDYSKYQEPVNFGSFSNIA